MDAPVSVEVFFSRGEALRVKRSRPSAVFARRTASPWPLTLRQRPG